MKNRNAFKHGMTHSKEYRAWSHMLTRCNNPKYNQFHRYGGRGIRVCDEWKEFQTFYRDMGVKPSPSHSLDRIDNNKGYSKENCRWATRKQQNLNYSRNKCFTYRGVTKPLSEWAEEINMAYSCLYTRIFREHLSFHEAITKPYRYSAVSREVVDLEILVSLPS